MEYIKLYRREIRPLLYELPTQGFSAKYTPLFNKEDRWFPENEEEKIRQRYEQEIEKKNHGWVKLTFEERYIDDGDRYILHKAEDFPIERE